MVIPTGYAQVNYVFGGPAQPRGSQVTHGVQLVGGSPLVTPQDVAAFAKTTWETTLGTLQISGVKFIEARVKFGPNASGGDATVTSGMDGGKSSSGEAPQVAVLIRKRTALGGRTGRGRMFVPGAPETDVVNGSLQGGALTQWEDTADDFLAAWNTAQAPMVILHTEGTAGPVIVTDFEVQALTATQRRRLRKVGGRRSTLG